MVELDQDFFRELLAASREVGTRWLGTTKLPSDLSLRSPGGWHHVFWPRFLAAIFGDRNLILPLVYRDQPWVRWGAVEALAETWPDENTRALLALRAVQDDHLAPRRAAASGVGREVARRDHPVQCWNSGSCRTTTTLPASRRFRRWPGTGPTRPRDPFGTAGRPGCQRVRPQRRNAGVGREVARRGHACPARTTLRPGSRPVPPHALRCRHWPRGGPTRPHAPCSTSELSRMTTTLPAPPRCRR